VKWYEKINNPDPGKWKYERREWLQLLGTDLRFVNVGQETAICANKILVVMRSGSAEAKRKMKDLLLAGGKILDITSGLKARSIIILDNWSIIISPIKPITLMNKINTMYGAPASQEAEDDSEGEEDDNKGDYHLGV
jgi:regulator of extracellular matrix RemA (YlzA/DUF370 family)